MADRGEDRFGDRVAAVMIAVSTVTLLGWIVQYAMVPRGGWAPAGTDPHVTQRGDVTRAGAAFTAAELQRDVLVAAVVVVVVLACVAVVRYRRSQATGPRFFTENSSRRSADT